MRECRNGVGLTKLPKNLKSPAAISTLDTIQPEGTNVIAGEQVDTPRTNEKRPTMLMLGEAPFKKDFPTNAATKPMYQIPDVRASQPSGLADIAIVTPRALASAACVA